jgi:hypothetical protein
MTKPILQLLVAVLVISAYAGDATISPITPPPDPINLHQVSLLQTAGKTLLLPSWPSMRTENYLIATAQGAFDLIALSFLFDPQSRLKGFGAMLIVNRLLSLPVNLISAGAYNSRVRKGALENPKYDYSDKSFIGFSYYRIISNYYHDEPFGIGILLKYGRFRSQVYLESFFRDIQEEYWDSNNDVSVYIQKKNSFKIILDYRLNLHPAFSLNPGAVMDISGIDYNEYGYGKPVYIDQHGLYDQTYFAFSPKVSLEMKQFNRLTAEIMTQLNLFMPETYKRVLEGADERKWLKFGFMVNYYL